MTVTLNQLLLRSVAFTVVLALIAMVAVSVYERWK